MWEETERNKKCILYSVLGVASETRRTATANRATNFEALRHWYRTRGPLPRCIMRPTTTFVNSVYTIQLTQ